MKKKDKFLIILSACLLIILSIVITLSSYENSKKSIIDDNLDLKTPKIKDQIQCTMDAKLCPDGSYVGRTGKNCEFATCPNLKK